MLQTMTVRATIAAILAGLAMSAHAIADSPKRVDIPAGDLRQALLQVSKQFGTDLVYRPEQIQGIQTRGAHGELTTEQAVTKLLQGTPLEVRTDPSGAMLIAPPAAAKEAPDSPMNPEIEQIDEVVVTGSHIRGNVAAGSKLIVIDRQAIEASGYSRLQDVMRDLPQNFGVVGDTIGADVNNGNRGAEIQLRGLGSGTTLTLVNGQRQAAGGESGNFVDISSIATSAIERIEILSEGASALYGSDAIGGVVNIVLRKDFEGFETSVRGSTAGGDADEMVVSQLWGTAWSRGRVLVGYQYDERDALAASSRAYAASNGDFRRFGGSDWRTVGGKPGTVLDRVTQRPIGAIPSDQDGTNLTPGQLLLGESTYFDNVTYSALTPEQAMHSALLSASYDITDQWAILLDGRYSSRDVDFSFPQAPRSVTVPVTNAFNRFGAPVLVAYDFTKDVGPRDFGGTTETLAVSLGVNGSLGGLWGIKLSGGYAEEDNIYLVRNIFNATALQTFLRSSDPSSAFNVFGDASNTSRETIASLQAAASYGGRKSIYSTSSVDLIANGPLFDMPAGAVKLAVGSSYREEELDNLSYPTLATRGSKRDVSALFAELAVPIWQGRQAASSASPRLELSLAGRFEDYNDFGTTFNPKVGLSWRPFDSLKVRGTWGTSFRAPPLSQIGGYAGGGVSVTSAPDPQSSTGVSTVLAVSPADPDLSEETAEVWTAGVDFAPSFLEGVALSWTFFDISYEDKIANPPLLEMLRNEAQYSQLIVRNPTQAQINALCVDAVASGLILTGNCNQPIAAIVEIGATNLSSLQTRGVDTDLSYTFATDLGQWRLGVVGTYILDYTTTVADGLPSFDPLDTYRNPLSLRVSGNVSWRLGDWSAHAAVNHLGDYKESAAAGSRRIDSWTTVNLGLGYHIHRPASLLDDCKVTLGVLNVLDEEPPFVNIALSPNRTYSATGYDTANANILGRQISMQILKSW